MGIVYSETQKDLPVEQLHSLFVSVGWSDGTETQDMINKGYYVPWVNSTLVISAWSEGHLIGAVRVLSDTMFRSTIYDLLVLPEFQRRGIGSELLKRCIRHFPKSEWFLTTEKETAMFYKKNGFEKCGDGGDGVFLSIPCKLFSRD